MLSPRVGIFTICSKLKLVRYSKKSSYIVLDLHGLLMVSFGQSKSGKLKSPKIQMVLFFGILFTDSKSSERLFSSSLGGL